MACNTDKKVAPKEGRIGLQENITITPSNQKVQLGSESSSLLVNTPFYNSQNKKPAIKKISTANDWQVDSTQNQVKNGPLLPAPITGKENVYTLDSEFTIRAHKRSNGQKLWEKQLAENEIGIALIKNGAQLIALSQSGKLFATNTDGKILWQKDLNAPFRNTPVLEKDTLYLLSANNDLWALNIQKGQEKWHYKTDAPITFLQQMGTPAVSQNIIVVPFSSGLVIAFDKVTGAYLWEEDMSGAKSFDRISNMAQMIASPVIDENIVYLVGHANKTGAFKLKDGQKVWTIPYAGQLTPLISANAIFILTNKNELLALNKKDGKLFWQQAIPEIQGKKAMYMLDNKIIILGTERCITFNAKTGKIENFFKTNFDGSVPVIAQDGWYYLRKNGKLIHKGSIQ